MPATLELEVIVGARQSGRRGRRPCTGVRIANAWPTVKISALTAMCTNGRALNFRARLELRQLVCIGHGVLGPLDRDVSR
jgi:hypothetical protein